MMKKIIWILLICANVYHAKESGVRFKTLASVSTGWAFQGHLNENERIVKLSPELRGIPVENVSQSMQICGVYVHHEADSLFPFLIRIVDKKLGNAEVKLKDHIKTIDLVDRYAFQVEMFDCDQPPHFSERKFVFIEVGSVYGPKFLKSSYHFTINSSLPVGAKIGEIVAVERPLSSKSNSNQGICKYDILPVNSVPFTIDKYGSLHADKISSKPNTIQTYRFYVRATDCDKHQPRITSVPVWIEVHDSCQSHWEGLPSNITYFRNKGVIPLISIQSVSPSLHVCSNGCPNFNIELTVKLVGNKLNIASTDLCKQDLQSINKQEMLCDASIHAINLLKNAPNSLLDNDNGGYFFSASHIPIERNLDNTNHIFGKTFSLSFWMKHDKMELNDPKQQILCNSDLHVMNRHHFSLFLHNCKLILLIRLENWEVDENVFRPTEWRFGPLKEVCDNKWHHYSVSLNEGNPSLQIDGEMQTSTPELLVEKPLRKLPGNRNGTRLTVGSCYHSKIDSYVQNFVGNLAGMRLIKKYVEAVNTIRCLATCGESLLLPHIVEVIDNGSSVTMFSDYVVMRSNNINDLKLMFSKLSYVNTNPFINIDKNEETERTISISTHIKCELGEPIKISNHSLHINIVEFGSVSNRDSPSVEIYSKSNVQGPLKKPLKLFPDVIFSQVNGHNVTPKLKSCIIRPINHLIRSWEYINWPVNLAINYHLTSLNNTHGLVLEGKQSVYIYQMLLREITFVTSKYDPENNDRKFGLICAITDKRVTNEHVVTVRITADDLSTYYILDDKEADQYDPDDKSQVLHSSKDRKGFPDKTHINEKNSINSSVVIPIVGVVLSVILIGSIISGILVYRKLRMKKSRLRRNFDSNSNNVFKLVPRKSEKIELNETAGSDEDVNSITSDCPESCEDHEICDNEHLGKCCQEEDNNNVDDDDDDGCVGDDKKCNGARINIPKYMNLPNKSWRKQLNEPVDV